MTGREFTRAYPFDDGFTYFNGNRAPADRSEANVGHDWLWESA